MIDVNGAVLMIDVHGAVLMIGVKVKIVIIFWWSTNCCVVHK